MKSWDAFIMDIGHAEWMLDPGRTSVIWCHIASLFIHLYCSIFLQLRTRSEKSKATSINIGDVSFQ